MIAAAALVSLVVVAAHRSRPTESAGGTTSIDGIPCQNEMLSVHFHAHLALLQDGSPVDVPAGVGIRQGEGCLYWLHTHPADGVIHIESPTKRKFTLGQFFDVWGQTLSESQADGLSAASGQTLTVFVDGQPYTGDPREISLTPHREIVIEGGKQVPPPSFTFPAGE